MSPTSVRLREYVPDDADALAAAVRESLTELKPWMPWCRDGFDRADAAAWIDHCREARARDEAYEFAVAGEDGALLGACGLNRLQPDLRLANLGFWVRSAAAGRGVATAVVRALAGWAFLHTELARLEIVTAVGNTASQRVAEKAGALREGVLRERLFLHGRGVDAVVYALLRSRWRS